MIFENFEIFQKFYKIFKGGTLWVNLKNFGFFQKFLKIFKGGEGGTHWVIFENFFKNFIKFWIFSKIL